MAINNSFFYKRRSVTAKNMLANKVSEDDLKDMHMVLIDHLLELIPLHLI